MGNAPTREEVIRAAFALSKEMGIPVYVYRPRVENPVIITPDEARAMKEADDDGITRCAPETAPGSD